MSFFKRLIEKLFGSSSKGETERPVENKPIEPTPVETKPSEIIPWYEIAKKELGVSEKAGSAHNPRIVEYHSYTTLKATDDETPWCSSFVTWCLEKSGIKSTKSAWARSYLDWGTKIDVPYEGCVVIFSRNKTSGHVGFFVKEDSKNIFVLGGNQGDEVSIKPYSKKDFLGYRTPTLSTIEIEIPKEEIKEEPKIETNKDIVNDGNAKAPDWAYLWDNCIVDSDKVLSIKNVVKNAILNKEKYKSVESKTGVPWKLIACIHYKECSMDFTECLHNGDKLPGPTKNVPKGRGPFSSWEEAAIDALNLKKKIFPSGWTDINMLIFAQKYNGMGHQMKGLEYSPYIWAYTNHHDETGNYVSDGKYSSSAPIKSPGIAAILKELKNQGY